MCWKVTGNLARNIDFGVTNFQVLRKTRRKTSILKLQRVKIGGSLARNARFDAPTCLVSSLVFLWPRRVYGGSYKTSPVRRCPSPKQVVMSFCVAGTALRDIPTCLITCRNWFCVAGAKPFASFSQDELQFPWQAQHFGDLCRHFAWQAQNFRRVALPALHSTLHSPHFTLHTLHFTLHTLHSTLSTPLSTLYTPHSTLYTLDSALYTPDFTLYTPHLHHSTLYHSTLHTLQL